MAQQPELEDLDDDPEDQIILPDEPPEVPAKPDADDIEIVMGEEEPKPAPKPDGLGGLEDEDESYSDKVRKRIAREARLKEQARQDAVEARREADEAHAELAKLRAKHQVGEYDKEVKTAQEELKQARSDGDVDKEIAAATKIADIQAKKANIREEPPVRVERDTDGNPAREAWLKRNAWYTEEKYEAQADTAASISARLIAKGKDPSEPKFWQELDRELGDAVKLPEPSRPRPAVAGGNDPPPARNPKRVVITADDKSRMRRYHLDPENPEHLKEWARNKIA